MTSAPPPAPADGTAPRAISFDFGNTLCAVSDEALRTVLLDAAERVSARSGPFAIDEFTTIWREEARRQFAINVPLGRENDLGERMVRVLARLRGMEAPPQPPEAAPPGGDGPGRGGYHVHAPVGDATVAGLAWDDTAAARLSDPEEVVAAVRDYGECFVERMPVDERAEPLLARLRGSFRLAILSNWPLAWAIDRIADRAGWTAHLDAIIVSERVGLVKPHPAIFAATSDALGVSLGELLHVGDDWAADIVGARRAGVRAAYLDARPDDSPLPSSEPDGSVEPEVVLRDLLEIEPHLASLSASASPSVTATAPPVTSVPR